MSLVTPRDAGKEIFMGWDPLLSADIVSGAFATTTRMQKIKDCLGYLYLLNSVPFFGVLNGNFEADSDGDGLPDNWTVTYYPGGSGRLLGSSHLPIATSASACL